MVSDLNLLGTGEQLDHSLDTVISKFKLLRQETGIVRSTADPMKLNPHEGRSKNITTYGRVVAEDLSDGVDMTKADTLSDTPSTYTPNEVGVQVIIPGSTIRRSADERILANTAKMLNNAYDLKEDTDGVAQYSSFTTTFGSAGTVLSPGHVEAMASGLAVGNNQANPEPAPKPLAMVWHPQHGTVMRGRIGGLADDNQGATAFGVAGGAHRGVVVGRAGTALQERLLVNGPGSLGKWAGFNIKEDANIRVDGNDDAVLAGYSTEGLVYVSELEPVTDPDKSDKSMRGAVELNTWGSYVYGVYRAAAFGGAGTFDAALPSS